MKAVSVYATGAVCEELLDKLSTSSISLDAHFDAGVAFLDYQTNITLRLRA